MSEVFFISDTHFGHRGIITFSGTKPFRPFATIEEHDAELVRRWNSVVGKKDTMWHLGDFCFGKRNLAIAGELNGNKRLVMPPKELPRKVRPFWEKGRSVLERVMRVSEGVPPLESHCCRVELAVRRDGTQTCPLA